MSSEATTTTSTQRFRIRPRPGRVVSIVAVAAALSIVWPSVEALSSVAPVMNHPTKTLPSTTIPSIEEVKSASHWAFLEEDDDEEDEFYDMSDFQQFKESTGSEIMNTELQNLVDKGPNQFLEQMGGSELEKLAMSSVTEQLPQPAVQALLQQQQQQLKRKKKKNQPSEMHYSRTRVTAQEEIELAKLIQHGASLYKIKQEQELVLDRPLSKQEWADAVQLTPKKLRQTISNYRQAKHQLVTANMGLVHAVVNKIYNPRHASPVSKEELVQEGSLGLLRAAELFDPSRGLRFSTYAVVWIKGVLSNSHVPELVKLPTREKTKMNKITRAYRQVGETASVEELASVAGLSVPEVLETQRRMAQTKQVLSLDAEHKMQSRSGVAEGSAGGENPLFLKDKNFQQDADLAERTQLQADVIATLARSLDAREARLMRLRYGLSDGHSRTLEECADAMGLSYSRVQQLSKTCLKKLRTAAEAESLEEYLLTIA